MQKWIKAEYWYRKFLSNGVVHFQANINIATTLINIGQEEVFSREAIYLQALERAT